MSTGLANFLIWLSATPTEWPDAALRQPWQGQAVCWDAFMRRRMVERDATDMLEEVDEWGPVSRAVGKRGKTSSSSGSSGFGTPEPDWTSPDGRRQSRYKGRLVIAAATVDRRRSFLLTTSSSLLPLLFSSPSFSLPPSWIRHEGSRSPLCPPFVRGGLGCFTARRKASSQTCRLSPSKEWLPYHCVPARLKACRHEGARGGGRQRGRQLGLEVRDFITTIYQPGLTLAQHRPRPNIHCECQHFFAIELIFTLTHWLTYQVTVGGHGMPFIRIPRAGIHGLSSRVPCAVGHGFIRSLAERP